MCGEDAVSWSVIVYWSRSNSGKFEMKDLRDVKHFVGMSILRDPLNGSISIDHYSRPREFKVSNKYELVIRNKDISRANISKQNFVPVAIQDTLSLSYHEAMDRYFPLTGLTYQILNVSKMCLISYVIWHILRHIYRTLWIQF